MVSTVSSLTSKHFHSFAHCPYLTRYVSIVAYHNNAHHLHHFCSILSMDTNPVGFGVATMLPPTWGLWVSTDGQGCPGSHSPFANLIVHPSSYNGNQSQQSLQWTHLVEHQSEINQSQARPAIPECNCPIRGLGSQTCYPRMHKRDRLSQYALQICTE